MTMTDQHEQVAPERPHQPAVPEPPRVVPPVGTDPEPVVLLVLLLLITLAAVVLCAAVGAGMILALA
jgi:hypothetical protein